MHVEVFKFALYISCRKVSVFFPVILWVAFPDKHSRAPQTRGHVIIHVQLESRTHFQRYNGTTHERTPRKSLPNLTIDLTGRILKSSKYPVAYGGFSDVWSCHIQWNQSPTRVAVKAIRLPAADSDGHLAKQKAVERELNIWARLKHHNILPLYGVTSGFGPFPAFVSPWAENGTLTEYLEEHREQLDLKRRLALLADVSAGICYLHSQKVVHGDLSGSNVLISGDGRACLSDFGLSTTSQEVSDASQTPSFPINIRWVAPELFLEQEEGTSISRFPSQETDIYSFGSIMSQVLTGKLPFHGVRRVAQIVLLVSRGQRPQRELGWDGEAIPDALWDFIERCWRSPFERPSSGEVVRFIESVS